MATAKTTSAPGASKQTPWLLITLIVLMFILAAAGAVGGTWLYMSGRTHVAQTHEEQAPPLPDPVYVAVEPFTVNLHDEHGRILYIGVSLKVADKDVAKLLKNRMPQVRNRILLTLTRQDADTLMTPRGKQALAAAIRKAVSRPFNRRANPLAVTDVLFTNFIVQ